MSLITSDSLRWRRGSDRNPGNTDGLTGDDCRQHAAYYVEQARRDPERKRHLLGMAKSWIRLAARADRIQALSHQERSLVSQIQDFGA